MTTRDTTTQDLVVQQSYAQVFVSDVTASVAWYRDVLGFELEFDYGEPPFYAQVRRGGAVFNLRLTDPLPWAPGPEDAGTLLAVRIDVSDCEALHRELAARGAHVVQPPRLEPWKQTTMIVADADGNLIGFGSEGS